MNRMNEVSLLLVCGGWRRTCISITALATATFVLVVITHAPAEPPSLPHKLNVTPEIKTAFKGSDAITIREITGTAPKFQVGGTYRVTGVCHQESLRHGTLYI